MAVLDFNHNIHRKTKTGKDGKPMYKMKVRLCILNILYVLLIGFVLKLIAYVILQVDRTGAKVTIVEQKEKKDYTFEDNILDLCLQCLDRGVVPDPVVPKRNFSSKL